MLDEQIEIESLQRHMRRGLQKTATVRGIQDSRKWKVLRK